MLKERARIIALAVFTVDLLLVSCAFVAAHWLRAGPLLDLGAVSGRIYPLTTYLPLLPLDRGRELAETLSYALEGELEEAAAWP